MPTPRKLEDYVLDKKWERLFAGLDEQMEELSKRAEALNITPTYLEYAIEGAETLKLKKMPHSLIRWHFTNYPGPRGKWDVMTNVMKAQDGSFYLVKDFVHDVNDKKKESIMQSESPAKKVYRNMRDLRGSLIKAGKPEYISPVPQVKLATLIETRENDTVQSDLIGDMPKSSHLGRGIPTLESDSHQLLIEFVGEGTLLKNVLEDKSWSSSEREEMILTIIDQMLELDAAMDTGKIKRFRTGSISNTNDLYYTKIDPPENPSLRLEFDELYPRKGRLIIINWEELEDVEQKKPLEMTRSFVSALKTFISGKHPKNTITTLDFTDNDAWGKSDFSLATRWVISEIINRKTMTVEDAKLLIAESLDLINMSTEDLHTKQKQLAAAVIEQDKVLQVALTTSQRSQHLQLKVNPEIFKLTHQALIYTDILARAMSPDSHEKTILTDLLPEFDSMLKQRIFKHLNHAFKMASYQKGLAIINELLPHAVEEKSFKLAQHLMRSRKLFTFVRQTIDLDLPASIRSEINNFFDNNFVDLNLDWMKDHTYNLETLFGEIDEFCMQNEMTEDARGSIKDFMAEIKYSIAIIEADEIRTNVDLKAEKYTKAKEYLSDIHDLDYRDLIDQTAPDLDRIIEQCNDIQGDNSSQPR